MNAPPSNRDLDREEADDERRKAYQEQERDAAIQRSRQKRRVVNQVSVVLFVLCMRVYVL
jgi:hypothetical protein